MATRNGSAPAQRCHIVLVPGFGGFDALGRIQYYSGITALFQDWCKAHPKSSVVLHYFDNLPTAAVVTRAYRLRQYLAKRMVRQEMAPGDRIVLVGHSTGGLDIRQLIRDLDKLGKGSVSVDGASAVDAAEVLDRIDGVVFLSVPHWGTNIAEWVYSNAVLRRTVLGELRLAFEGSQLYLLDRFEAALAEGAWGLSGSEVLLALRDTLTEANDDWSDDPTRVSDAQEAASELQLYFRQMAKNFHVIEDLAPVPHNKQTSPAHFKPQERENELKCWKQAGIRTLSYASVGGRVLQFQAGRPAPMFSVANPCDYVQLLGTSERNSKTDIGYRLCYRACAGGPLKVADPGHYSWVLGPDAPVPLEVWDNDGIVNTISMLWPAKDATTVLVQADHLDIVGHRLLRKTQRQPGGGEPPRTYESYDTLKSAPHFKQETLRHVWEEIFAFAALKKFPTYSRPAPEKALVAAAAAGVG